ncbi:MAG: hypothetical protein ACE5J5_09185, partial [Candidatus Hydrothermarchaeales archaeon]
ADYVKTFQTIKERNENGEMITTEVIDDVLSGFQPHNIPADEILISNPYQFHLQKQKFLIKKRFIDYDEVRSLYGNHENHQYVQRGIRTLYTTENEGTFYDQVDEELDSLAEEAIWYHRTEDMQVGFVNGIYMGDDDVTANPIKHRDNMNRPKYPLAKLGFEPIDEKRFFFYKSLAFKLTDDQDLADQMFRMTMDGTYLSVMPPLAVEGGEKVDSSVIFPGAVTNFGKDSRVTPISVGQNLQAGYRALQEIERSMAEGSQDKIRAGVTQAGDQTAFEISKQEENARRMLGIFGKMISGWVIDFGSLMVDDIIHHQTIGEVEEILGGDVRMKYRSFLLPEQIEKGRKVTRKIIFDEALIGQRMTEKEKLQASFEALEEQGGIDSDTFIYRVNPQLFSRLKYLLYLSADILPPKSEAHERIMKMLAYDRLIQNPFVDQENVTRDFLVRPWAQGESDKYMKKAQDLGIQSPLLTGGRPPQAPVVGPVARTPAPAEVLQE